MADEDETKRISSWPVRNTKILVNVLADEANHAYTVAQVQGKFNHLCAKHREFSTLFRDQSGFGWNSETNTMTTSEEAWQKHLNKHPKTKVFRNNGYKDYSLLGLIYNNSMATGGPAHGSSHDPGDTNAEEAAEKQMDSGIHVDNGGGERTDINMDCYQPDEAIRRSISGNIGVVTGQARKARKKKGTQALLMSETFQAMTEHCRVRTQHTLAKMETSHPSMEGSSRAHRNLQVEEQGTVWECLEILQKYGSAETHGQKYLDAAERFQSESWREAFLVLPE
ncbi:hypothetical protein CJ030_MR4G002214 [Morella rubra]|nr:hypothetical protein CJ030_MR4G002214 [Morella rubra]